VWGVDVWGVAEPEAATKPEPKSYVRTFTGSLVVQLISRTPVSTTCTQLPPLTFACETHAATNTTTQRSDEVTTVTAEYERTTLAVAVVLQPQTEVETAVMQPQN
jgi:hypothetical protein